MINQGKLLKLALLISGFLITANSYATAIYDSNTSTLSIPVVSVDNSLFYQVNMQLISDSPILLQLTDATLVDSSEEVSATYDSSTLILSIPTLDVYGISYNALFTQDSTLPGYQFELSSWTTGDNGTALTTGSTDGVLCNYTNTTLNSQPSLTATSTSEWTCAGITRELTANGIPDHEVGTFPNENNPNTITEQSVSASLTLAPTETTSATVLGGPAGVTGYILNGVKIDAGTAGSCDDSGTACSLIDNSGNWHIEALGQTSFNFGTDDNNAHVQPDGQYHYHGMPEGFITKRGGNSSVMTLIGWAADGFPIYARYGYSIADDASSELKSITGSYQLISSVSDSRPSTDTYALGTFNEDWEYVESSGDLDECNGRVGVTPEFPDGIYHYYATDSYPYFQRCVKGAVEAGNGGMPPQQ